jgi:hypothetical protein
VAILVAAMTRSAQVLRSRAQHEGALGRSLPQMSTDKAGPRRSISISGDTALYPYDPFTSALCLFIFSF